MSENKESYLEALRRYPDQKPYSPNFHGAFMAGAEWQRADDARRARQQSQREPLQRSLALKDFADSLDQARETKA